MSRRFFLLAAGAILLLIALVTLTLALTDDGLGLLERDQSPALSYLAIFLLTAGDAVIPILPGETTLNAAAVLASQDELDLVPVIVAGALGAIVGDNALYWIARSGPGGIRNRLTKAREDDRVERVLQVLGNRAPMLIVFGRYVPGVRFAVNASMGVIEMPYRRFLLWSSIGGSLWATYTCLLAYAVGSAIAELPLASVVISGLITTLFIIVIYILDMRGRHHDGSSADHD
jgi:membrane protein DedA with SNARE-associated domain